MSSTDYIRLPQHITPEHYDITYTNIDFTGFTFSGQENVLLQVNQSTNRIICHAMELYCTKVLLQDINGHIVEQCHNIQYLTTSQVVIFSFEQSLEAQRQYKLHIEFEGKLNDELRGLYRSEYENIHGEKKIMAVTQFEACDARRAFVCWDEPNIKSTYELTVIAPSHFQVISNTPVVQTKTYSTMQKEWKYERTPKMSTYLLAVVIGEFDQVSTYTTDGVLVTVYTPLGKSSQGKFALHVASRAIPFYAKRYGIDYPLKKLDMLAIPDFAAGAMENWGCITYRETRLLIDTDRSSLSQKKAVARTVCHELVHQWFGNLVTMDWWTELWLNEGFARFMEFDAVNPLFPEWKVWEEFVQQITVSSAMHRDAMMTTHPIEVEVQHPDEVDQIFDVISYAKGASIIRMLYEYLGQELFDQGIHYYLTKYQYANAKTIDLWNAFEAVTKQNNIAQMMNSWTKQMGFPVLTISEDNTCTQQRFTIPSDATDATGANTWELPLTAISSSSPNESLNYGVGPIFSSTVLKDLYKLEEWFKLNPKQSGFYIVNYTVEQWKRLAVPINSKKIGTVDRLTLIGTAFYLARSGHLSILEALKLCAAYENEMEYLCWKEISKHLRYYHKLTVQQPCQSKFERFIYELYEQPFKHLQWKPQPDEMESTGLFRKEVLSMISLAASAKVQAEAKERFDAYITGKESLAPDLRSIVFNVVAKQFGTSTLQTQLIDLYSKSDLIEEKLDCLIALGKIADDALRSKYLDWAVLHVRSQDISYPFAAVASNGTGVNFAWTYIQQHWDKLHDKFVPFILGRIVVGVIQNFNTEEKAMEVETFLENRKHESYTRSLDTALEAIRTKNHCMKRDLPLLNSFYA